MEPSALREALALLRRAVEDLVGAPVTAPVQHGPELRIGTLEVRPAGLQVIDLPGADTPELMAQILAVEGERYGGLLHYPPDVLKAGRRPLLQYPAETLETTLLRHPRSCGVALWDRVSRRVVAFALGSPLENHDELGVRDDPRYGENDTFYLQAMAVSPQLRNQLEVEVVVLDALRARVERLGFTVISTLIEARLRETGPRWIRTASALETVDNYLHSGICFVYLQASRHRAGARPGSHVPAAGDHCPRDLHHVMISGAFACIDDKSSVRHEGYLVTPVTKLELMTGFNVSGAIKAVTAGLVVMVVGPLVAGIPQPLEPARLLKMSLLIVLTALALVPHVHVHGAGERHHGAADRDGDTQHVPLLSERRGLPGPGLPGGCRRSPRSTRSPMRCTPGGACSSRTSGWTR